MLRLSRCTVQLNSFVARKFSSQSSAQTAVTEKNGVRTITMTQSRTRNSLSTELMADIIRNIKNDKSNKYLRVIVIQSEGPVFSSGHSFKEMTQEVGTDTHKKVFSLSVELMKAIIDSPVPIIAKVDGLAAAGGCQLVAQCDIAVCSEQSSFSAPGSNFGIFCSTPGVAISRSVPHKTALYMLFTGEPLTSHQAFATGLVSKVCKKEELDAEVDRICGSIVNKSRAVVELGKRFYYKQIQETDVKKAYEMGAEVMVNNISNQDGIEGIRSFVEKRKPTWNN